MKRLLLVIGFLGLSLASLAQNESSRFYQMIGFGAGYSFNPAVEVEGYAPDLFSESRGFSLFAQLGAGYRLNEKNHLELCYNPMSFRLSEPRLATRYQERLPNHHVYHDFNLDNTNSTGNGVSMHQLSFRYKRIYPMKKIQIVPVLGVGVGLWRHRDFQYILREKTTNQYSTYTYDLKATAIFTFTAQSRIVFNRYPNFNIVLSYSGMPSKYRYSVEVVQNNTSEPTVSDNIHFKRYVHTLHLGILF